MTTGLDHGHRKLPASIGLYLYCRRTITHLSIIAPAMLNAFYWYIDPAMVFFTEQINDDDDDDDDGDDGSFVELHIGLGFYSASA